jgi:hypothetical protein
VVCERQDIIANAETFQAARFGGGEAAMGGSLNAEKKGFHDRIRMRVEAFLGAALD